MVENLGEAIGLGTTVQGNFGNPITQGLQLNQRNELQRIAQEQRVAEQENKKNQQLAKYISSKDGKFINPKYQVQFGEYYKQNLPKLIDAVKSNDFMEQSRLENEMINKLGMLKMIDKDEAEINKNVRGSITRPNVREIYSKKGSQGIEEHNKEYWFAPIANIDPESGHLTVIDVESPKLDKVLTNSISTALAGTSAAKRVGNIGNIPQYKIDKDSQEYKILKQNTINDLVNNDELMKRVIYQPEFKEFYSQELKKHGINPEQADEKELEAVLSDYITKKYDDKEKTIVKINKTGTPSANSNSNFYSNTVGWYTKPKPDFFPVPQDDGTINVGTISTSTAKPTFAGTEFIMEGGKKVPLGKTRGIVVVNPKVKHLGGDKFEVYGADSEGDDVNIEVDGKELRTQFSLTDKGLKGWFPKYGGTTPQSKPANNAAPNKQKTINLGVPTKK